MKPDQIEKTEVLEVSGSDGYESILSALSAGIVRLDENGTITYSNDSAAELLNKDVVDLVGSSFARAFFEEEIADDDARRGPLQFTLAEREISHVNTEQFVRPDETSFLAEYICVPLENKGEKDGAVISFADVTEQRNTERAVSEARDAALEAAKSKAEFLANMSHEIRTPLTGIIGIVELLSGDHTEAEREEFLRVLKSSTEFLHTIVNDILDFSKIEAGKFRPKTEEFRLSELLALAVDPFRSSAEAKNLQIDIRFDEDSDGLFNGDARSIRQILTNLISNAVKFTEKGGVEVSATANETGDLVCFRVKDTGSGIVSEKQADLFAPFVQADNSDARAFEGTGLGLAISRRLVKLLGGDIGFSTKAAIGSELWFEIPVSSGFEMFEPKVEETGVCLDRNLRILIVEDNPVTAFVTERMLRNAGISSVTAESGDAALRMCSESEFDVVLMDCQMPEMDGYETAKRMRMIVKDDVRIIAFTASVAESEDQKRKDAGMDGVLHKPFTVNELIEAIGEHTAPAASSEFLDTGKDFIQDSLSKFIDREHLERLISLESKDPRGFLSEILSLFMEHAEEKLRDLELALNEQDRRSVEQASHNLRGSSANLGISTLSGLFRSMELCSNSSDWEALEQQFDEIKLEFSGLQRALAGSK